MHEPQLTLGNPPSSSPPLLTTFPAFLLSVLSPSPSWNVPHPPGTAIFSSPHLHAPPTLIPTVVSAALASPWPVILTSPVPPSPILARVHLALTQQDEAPEAVCGSGSPYDGRLGLRVGAIFIILSTSAFGTLFPIISRRSRLAIPELVYKAFKFFGSGVIIATALVHLLTPAFESLGSECLAETGWSEYPYAAAICLASIFAIFLVELIATRGGNNFLRKRGLKSHDPHSSRGNQGVGHTGHGLHPPTPTESTEAISTATQAAGGNAITEEVVAEPAPAVGEGNVPKRLDETADLEAAKVPLDTRIGRGRGHSHSHSHSHGAGHARGHEHGATDEDDEMINESAMAQIMGVAILEFGVLFHSFVIGLTLAVSEQLGPLLAVLTFHQMFEGIGLGARLSMLPLPRKYNYVPIVAAVVYACTTPLGIAIGLGIRETYNPDSAAAVITSGVLDAVSAGILLWAGLVECLAHDFVFDRSMSEASDFEVAFSVFFVLFGAGIMALLGRWA
ncbi:hypothetical protein JCM11251_003037 [Rhodosporidiobolus azoricus]